MGTFHESHQKQLQVNNKKCCKTLMKLYSYKPPYSYSGDNRSILQLLPSTVAVLTLVNGVGDDVTNCDIIAAARSAAKVEVPLLTG